jgi:hypothetical protein
VTADELGSRSPEQPGRHDIGESDQAVSIHDDDRVRVPLDHVAESGLTSLERLLQPLDLIRQ